MTLLSRLFGLFGSRPPLTPAQTQRLGRWRALPSPDLREPLVTSRCVVVDVETSGLNPARDRLIAIGAVAVDGGQISLTDTFEVILQQSSPSSHANILVHGIGGTAQVAGTEPAQALLDFLDFVGAAPLVAFHASFDETSIRRAMQQHLGADLNRPWLDLAYLAPAFHAELAQRLKSLDDWTAHFNIGNFARHGALADAYATAQLLLILTNASGHSNPALSFADLMKRERTQRSLLRLKE
ncbi:MAG TPA: 3'-5' exonuclease [Thiobacillaceae bacterium]|nr:3'-5' exonuclease [Thiobacillaceae bacterium]